MKAIKTRSVAAMLVIAMSATASPLAIAQPNEPTAPEPLSIQVAADYTEDAEASATPQAVPYTAIVAGIVALLGGGYAFGMAQGEHYALTGKMTRSQWKGGVQTAVRAASLVGGATGYATYQGFKIGFENTCVTIPSCWNN